MNELEPKVITLTNETQLVASVEEISADQVKLHTPLKITRHYSEGPRGMQESFALMGWIPFSDDLEYSMSKTIIANISTLGRAYVQDYYAIVEKTFYPEQDNESDPDETLADIFAYAQAVDNDQIH